ncbi:FAD-binding oxidoreductase [Alcaligenaceae bacterium]|nr:FAD-binding oxidoreductase [Alcaligenaceae bacterium]
MSYDSDVIVLGAGLVGSAIAYGLLRQGLTVTVIDEGDIAFRASRGNFGLVWVQGKGWGYSQYAHWTMSSAELWPELAADLRDETGVDVELRQDGGFHFCLNEQELSERADRLAWLQHEIGPSYQFEMLDQAALKEKLPGVGAQVTGASYTPMDGHVNPLKLFHALHQACNDRGARRHVNSHIDQVHYADGRYTVRSSQGVCTASRLILAAGLGNKDLAREVGLHAPIVPNQGQVLIGERVAPFLTHPTIFVRQTDEGSIQIGDSMEECGLDDTTRTDVLAGIARRAIVCFPQLADLNVVRTWAALRIMSPDGFPIYQESPTHPGAFLATCHSGVTLAAAHAFRLAPWIAGQPMPEGLDAFSGDRFLDPKREFHHGH